MIETVVRPTTSTQPRRRLIRVAASALLVTAALAVSGLFASVSADPDVAAVKRVATGAIQTQQAISLPPASYAGGPMSQGTASEMVRQGEGQMAQFFGGPELVRRDQALQANVSEQSSGAIRYLGAGVSRIDITSVTRDGDLATVAATVDLWADLGQVQVNGQLAVAHPKNTMLLRLALQKINGSWLVVDETMNYAPGSEP